MTADTLTADGAAATLALGYPANGYTYTDLSYAVAPDQQHVYLLVERTPPPSEAYAQTYSFDAYNTAGQYKFSEGASNTYAGEGVSFANPVMATLGNGSVAIAWQVLDQSDGGAHTQYVVDPTDGDYQGNIFTAGGGTIAQPAGADYQGPPTLFATIGGAVIQASYQSSAGGDYGSLLQTVDPSGHAVSQTDTSSPTPVSDNFGAHAYASSGSDYLQIIDNTLQYFGATLNQPIPVPGEGAGAITSEAAALLTNGEAAVVWSDANSESLAFYNPTSNTFTAPVVIDSHGTSDVHAVALPDGGFVVSWMSGGGYQGEVFDANGQGGPFISLAGDAAGVDANGDFYTVGMGSGGQYQIQHYSIGAGSSGGGTPGGGQAYTSDNNGDTWVGTASDDTFHLGRGGDHATGNGGNDTYDFAEIPWAGGHITDFNAGDVLDLTGLMGTTGDTGSDGFADGYLQITDSAGGAQVWAQYATSGSSSGWWLVETLDGVSASSLTTHGDTVTVGGVQGPTSVSTSDSHYVAPSYVTSITLTGSQQAVDASATNGVDITSNDTGNALRGGAGDDTFHLGRGGDGVIGGAGADTFSFAETPWAGGHIGDFNGNEGDAVDVSGLLAKSGYTGSDPFADGYLQLTSDTHGNAQLWSDLHQSGNDGWWLVTTMDGVSTSSLHYSGGLIT